ncbi:MAG: tannase/feruloyl esterase family alpha/beta hydrolase [Steroidobacteraceae bacterium]
MYRAVAVLGSLLVVCSVSARAADCATAAKVQVPHTTITAAQLIAAGEAAKLPEVDAGLKQRAQMMGGFMEPTPPTPAFCRVRGVIRPAATSDIKFEVWLPVSGWNERYWGVGNGGFAGYIAYPELLKSIARGYATSSTDAGHALGPMSAVALEDPERLKDFAERAIHLTAVAAKAIVAAQYGRDARYSYFSGCSNGGRQALIEAQRYPDDYDGILAGAPAAFFPAIPRNAWAARIVTADPRNALSPAKLRLLHRAALEQCDANDGLKDDLISEPMQCRFDPSKLRCASTETDQCLTEQQLSTAQQLYSTMDAKQAYNDALLPGTELGWTSVPLGAALSESWYGSVIYKDKPWHVQDFDAVRDVAIVRDQYGPLLNAASADLSKLAASGGKVIIYTGMADTLVPANHTIRYVDSVRSTMGPAADKVLSLFMAPGMGHCSGGNGFIFRNDGSGVDPASSADQDLAAALQDWVEKGRAPEKIVAARLDTSTMPPRPTQVTRPMCAYPAVARWNGRGDKNDAAAYSCVAAKP